MCMNLYGSNKTWPNVLKAFKILMLKIYTSMVAQTRQRFKIDFKNERKIIFNLTLNCNFMAQTSQLFKIDFRTKPMSNQFQF